MYLRNPESFRAWILQEGADDLDLLDWCHHGFGRGREAEPPHLELAAALPRGGDDYSMRRTLAGRMRRILERWPELRIPYPGVSSAPDWLLHELLSFAAMLHCGEELFDALWDVRLRLLESGTTSSGEVRAGLTKAFIHNQVKHHAGMLAVWNAMLAGTPDPVLGGTLEIGFEGAAMMPGDTQESRPDRKSIGEGLLALARCYQPDRENRWRRFRAWVLWLRGLWGLEHEGAYFIMLAHDFRWVENGQEWALQALPDLFASKRTNGQSRDSYLTGAWFAANLEMFGAVPTLGTFCSGRIKEIQFDPAENRTLTCILRETQGIARSSINVSEAEARLYVRRLLGKSIDHYRQQKDLKAADVLETQRNSYSEAA